ncbi:SIS domain-containing protein [Candidatus Neomarinimicrobiota bacterium]
MTTKANILALARDVIQQEAEALTAMQNRLGADFEAAVNIVLECKGRVVVAGSGKSGQISRKIAATLSSTGTPSFYLHPSDALHGDLGMIGRTDVLLVVSNSGETQEIIGMLPTIQVFKLPIIAILGRPNSTIGRTADVVLDAAVEREACPMDLAPTTSTTAALAMGDALAMALLEMRDFKPEDFALYHPGGALGKKLLTTVRSLMHTGASLPLINADAIMQDAVLEISEKALGVTGVVDTAGHLVGAITDGDLRRGLSRDGNLMAHPVTDFMTSDPKRIDESEMAVTALATMEDYSITALFVMSGEDDRVPVGLIHIHDILRTGIRR